MTVVKGWVGYVAFSRCGGGFVCVTLTEEGIRQLERRWGLENNLVCGNGVRLAHSFVVVISFVGGQFCLAQFRFSFVNGCGTC